MNKDFIIFKNPNLRFRQEDFGGVAKLKLKTLILNRQQYKLITGIKKFLVYNKLGDSERKIADKLIERDIFLKIDLTRARELGFKD